MVFSALLNNTFTVSRRTRTSDGEGGWVIGYDAISSVAGRIRPASSTEREVASSDERVITHVLYTEIEDIRRGDRVTCDDLVVEVVGIREPSKASHHLEIDCVERQEEVNT